MNRKLYFLVLACVLTLIISLLFSSGAEKIENMDSKELKEVSKSRLVSKVSENPDLLEKEEIREELSSRSSEDVSLLNDNPEVLKNWLSQKGVDNIEGDDPKLENVGRNDGVTTITTKGENSVSFEPRVALGSEVKEDGKVVFSGGTEVKNSKIIASEEGDFKIKGGEIDVSSKGKKEFVFENASVKYDGKKWSSSGRGTFKVEGGEIQVNGKDIYAEDDSGKKFRLSGSLFVDSQDNMVFGDNTEYKAYDNEGKILRSYDVKKRTSLVRNGECKDSISCIQKPGDGSLKVSASKNNEITINSGESVDRFEVKEITDKSSVVFEDEEGNKVFVDRDRTYMKEGSILDLSSDFRSTHTIDGKKYDIKISGNARNIGLKGQDKPLGIYSRKGDKNLVYRSSIVSDESASGSEELVFDRKGNLDEKGKNLKLEGLSHMETFQVDKIERSKSNSKYSQTNIFSNEVYELEDEEMVSTGEVQEKTAAFSPSEEGEKQRAILSALESAVISKASVESEILTSTYEETGPQGQETHKSNFEESTRIFDETGIKRYKVVDTGKLVYDENGLPVNTDKPCKDTSKDCWIKVEVEEGKLKR